MTDTASETLIDAAALRLLNAMFMSGVSAAEAIQHRQHDTEQWRRAAHYARLVLAPEHQAEPDSFGRVSLTLEEYRDACRATYRELRLQGADADIKAQADMWNHRAQAAQARLEAGEVFV